jgi:hypothetical protein
MTEPSRIIVCVIYAAKSTEDLRGSLPYQLQEWQLGSTLMAMRPRRKIGSSGASTIRRPQLPAGTSRPGRVRCAPPD